MSRWLFRSSRNLFRSEYRTRRFEVEDTDGSYAEHGANCIGRSFMIAGATSQEDYRRKGLAFAGKQALLCSLGGVVPSLDLPAGDAATAGLRW